MHLEALAVDDTGSGIFELVLRDPHGLEGGEGGQNGSTDPHGVLALRGGDDLDLHGRGGKSGHLLGETVLEAGVHGGTTGQNDVGVQVLADVDVALHDGVVGGLVHTGGFLADEGRVEEDLRAAEALVADLDVAAVGELVQLLAVGVLLVLLELSIVVLSNVGEALLDVTDDFALGGGGEGVATLSEDLHHVLGEVASSKVDTLDGVGESVTLVDRDSVGHTITRVEDDTGGTARSVQGQDSLDVDVHGRDGVGLEHDLGHLLTVGLGVHGGLSEEDGVLLRGDAELVVEGVVPDLLHVVPGGNDTVGDRVLEVEDTTLGLGLVTDVHVLVLGTNHGRLDLRAADDGREDSAGSVVTGESGLDHSGAVVHHEGGLVFLSHDESGGLKRKGKEGEV